VAEDIGFRSLRMREDRNGFPAEWFPTRAHRNTPGLLATAAGTAGFTHKERVVARVRGAGIDAPHRHVTAADPESPDRTAQYQCARPPTLRPVRPTNASTAPTTTRMIPMVHRIEILAMNPMTSRTTPRMIMNVVPSELA
jgi:hypothetical protein